MAVATKIELCDENNSSLNLRDQSKSYHKAIKISLITILSVLIGSILLTSIWMLTKQGFKDEDSGLRHISKHEWLARPVDQSELAKLNHLIDRVIISHTATEGCTDRTKCTRRVQNLQDFYLDTMEFSDIAFHFLVGGDGAVYEGRGWDIQGAHSKGCNGDSIFIAFIGTFSRLSPTEGQLNAAKLLIEEGVRLNKLVPDYRLYGARQLIPTESPGSVLYEIIKKWPHWSENAF